MWIQSFEVVQNREIDRFTAFYHSFHRCHLWEDGGSQMVCFDAQLFKSAFKFRLEFRSEKKIKKKWRVLNKAGYTAQDAPSSRIFRLRKYHETILRTDGPTDGRTDGHDLS